jgi:metal-responsive CopG/Arc/MetJ family transcriptional regulator
MKRTTISWPDDIAEEVERAARRRRKSVSATVREIVEGHLAEERKVSPFAGLIGVASKELPYSADQIDEELEKTYADFIRSDSGL